MKTILVTGAAGGLGKTVVQYLLDKEYRVIATVRKESDVQQFDKHAALRIEVLDLANEWAVASFADRLSGEAAGVDAAFFLAGGFTMGSVEETGLEDIRRMIALNFETAYLLARPLFGHMKKKGWGRLVFIGAQAPLMPAKAKHMLAYSLSKSLLFSLAEALNADAKGTNVTASVVVPGTIDTEQNRKAMPDADTSQWVTPTELAQSLHFLVSPESNALRQTVLKAYKDL